MPGGGRHGWGKRILESKVGRGTTVSILPSVFGESGGLGEKSTVKLV